MILGILAWLAFLSLPALAWLAWRRGFAPVLNMHLACAARRALPLDRVVAALAGDAPLGSGLYLGRVHEKLARGTPLHEALRGPLSRFPEGYLAAVEAAEDTGRLPRVLEAQKAVLGRWSDFSLRFLGAILYPVLMAWCILCATWFLRATVAPRFDAIMASLGGEFATLGKRSEMLQTCTAGASWMVLGLISAGALLLIVPGLAASLAARMLLVAGAGRTVAALALPGFFEQFAVLLKSGLSQKDAFVAAKRAVWLVPLRRRLDRAGGLWEAGFTFSGALSQAVAVPEWMRTLLRFGEGSGKLAAALEECAGIAREKARALRERGLEVLFFVLVVALGVLVALAAWAMFSVVVEYRMIAVRSAAAGGI